eukprot:Partr_v1_DN23912_c0_g1_i2_m48940 putative Esterase D
MAAQIVSKTRVCGGSLVKYSHSSAVTGGDMHFNCYLPACFKEGGPSLPAIYFLSGLTCNEDNFMQKAAAFKSANDAGIVLITPDTSPRMSNIDGEAESWDLGLGAGFYVDATESKWSKSYRMYSYVLDELPSVIANTLPSAIDLRRVSLMGHSMGGHGALMIFLKNPERFVACSAFAPIAHPSLCAWGKKAFGAYLGPDASKWAAYDSTELAKVYKGRPVDILIDQGGDDKFLKDGQLLPEHLVAASQLNPLVNVNYRLQEGYDHSYYFISTFVGEHIRWHASKFSEKS